MYRAGKVLFLLTRKSAAMLTEFRCVAYSGLDIRQFLRQMYGRFYIRILLVQ